MRAGGMVFTGLSLAIVILSGSVAARGESSRSVTDEQAGQIRFSGRVVDAAGAPIAGARVRFYMASSQDATLAGDTTTGTDGTFSFGAPSKRDGYRYGYIIAEQGDLAIGLANWRITEDEKTEIRLGRAKELAGIVVDGNDDPVLGARISVSMLQIGDGEQRRALNRPVSEKLLTVTTDAEGRFTFRGVPAEATAEFQISKAGRATVSTFQHSGYTGRGYRYLAGRKDIRLVLPLESRIEGIVVEKGTDRPVAGAKVMVADERNQSLPGLESALTDENGAFGIDALASGSYLVKFVAPSGGLADWVAEPVNVTIAAGQAKTDVKIELGKGSILEVLVTDAETGEPLEGARVSLYDQRRRQSCGGKTGDDGICRTRLLPGTYQHGSTYKEGYASRDRQKPITIMEGTTRRLKWKLAPRPSISGVVRDQTGTPIEGVSLRICPMGGLNDVKSDAEGKYKVSWDTGRFGDERQAPLLVCRHVGRDLGVVVIIPDDKRTLDIELRPAVTVRGKVADPDGQGIADARIRVMLRQTMWSSTMTRESINTDANGNFELRAIPPERRYELYVSADGYGNKHVEIHADDAVDNRLETETATLPVANLSVSGVLVDVQGNPVTNGRIEVRGYGDGQPDRVAAQSDSQGRFALEGVCEGKVNLSVDATHKGRRLSARAITNGGATGIKVVAREGSSVTQYLGTKSYDQIIAGNERAIAGVAVDESGSPLAGVPVGVRCHKKLRENGKFSWTFSSYDDLKATTDKLGRFAIPIKEDGEYNLLFSPDNKAALIVYDIPIGKRDLKVTLPAGGTITGCLVRIDKGKKVPIANAEVKIEQTDRASYTHIGFDRDRTTVTDSQGRFRFEHIRKKIRPHGSMSQKEWSHIPRVWKISYGDTSRNVTFHDGTNIDDFELIIELDGPQSLVGAALPEFDGMKIDSASDLFRGKMILVCFFDMEQRPSRRHVTQLAKQAEQLGSKGVAVIAVQTSGIEETALRKWIEKYNIPFPVASAPDEFETTQLKWAIRSLPWLILTDRKHMIRAAGFSPGDLEQKIRECQGIE